jgi:hypothetical protein
MEIHTAKPLVPERSFFVVQIAIATYKSLSIDEIPTETLCSEIHKLINSVWKKMKIASALEWICYCTCSQERR